MHYYLHLLTALIVSLTERCRSDPKCPAMPNFFLPASDLERSMKAIRDIGRQLPVAAKVPLFCMFLRFFSTFGHDYDWVGKFSFLVNSWKFTLLGQRLCHLQGMLLLWRLFVMTV